MTKEIESPRFQSEFLEALTGLSLEQATTHVQTKGGIVRIVAEDHNYTIITYEFMANRVNLCTENGLVSEAGYIG